MAPAVAGASPEQVLRECANDDAVSGNYSDADLRGALRKLTTELKEYSHCAALIRNQIGADGTPRAGASSVGGRGGRDGSGGAGAGASGSGDGARDRQTSQDDARRLLARHSTEEQLGDRSVDPSRDGVFKKADASSGLPLPVLLALMALALALVGGTFLAVKRRPALQGALKRVRLPRRGK